MEKITLTARARTGSGKSYTRKARANGWVPAAFYGFGVDPINVEVDHKEFYKMLKTKEYNKLIELVGEGIPADSVVVLRDVQQDCIRDTTIYHADFQKVDTARPIKTRAFLELTGVEECPAVKLGGILNKELYEVDLEGLVDAIPATLTLDVSTLEEGGAQMASAIVIPEGVKLLTSPARVAARILGKAK